MFIAMTRARTWLGQDERAEHGGPVIPVGVLVWCSSTLTDLAQWAINSRSLLIEHMIAVLSHDAPHAAPPLPTPWAATPYCDGPEEGDPASILSLLLVMFQLWCPPLVGQLATLSGGRGQQYLPSPDGPVSYPCALCLVTICHSSPFAACTHAT